MISNPFNKKALAAGALATALIATPVLADDSASTSSSFNTQSVSAQSENANRNYLSQAVTHSEQEGAISILVLLGSRDKEMLQNAGYPETIFGDKFAQVMNERYDVKVKGFTDTEFTGDTTGVSFFVNGFAYHDETLNTGYFNREQAKTMMIDVVRLYNSTKPDQGIAQPPLDAETQQLAGN
ncbi:MAG: hypothetical protein C9356_18990 [Oleiphilus sp.]|nr:MAG: hypothetical protein C9356_18990 [Oleiphilus sp.]